MEWAQLVATLVAALLGSGTGAWFALQRHRREQAFNHRIEWYEDACRTLHDMIRILEGATEQPLQHHSADKLWQQLGPKRRKLRLLFSLSALYATPDTHYHLKNVIDELDKFRKESEHEWRTGVAGAKRVQTTKEELITLRCAAQNLALDVRAQFGLKGIDVQSAVN